MTAGPWELGRAETEWLLTRTGPESPRGPLVDDGSDDVDDDYGAINDPPEPDDDPEEGLPPIPAAGWDELDWPKPVRVEWTPYGC